MSLVGVAGAKVNSPKPVAHVVRASQERSEVGVALRLSYSEVVHASRAVHERSAVGDGAAVWNCRDVQGVRGEQTRLLDAVGATASEHCVMLGEMP